MDDGISPETPADRLDTVLKKYGKLWLWSILLTFAATFLLLSISSMSMLLMNNRSGGVFSDTVMWVPAIAAGIEGLAIVLSIFWLFLFMIGELLPMFFAVEQKPSVTDGAQLLYRAFGSLLVGLAAQAAGFIILLVWRLRP